MIERTDQELEALLRAEFDAACQDAPVPAAGAVWWRATIRGRAEAAQRAGQPIAAFERIAVAVTVGVFAAFAALVWRSVSVPLLPLVLAIAGCAIVAPLAVYLATVDE